MLIDANDTRVRVCVHDSSLSLLKICIAIHRSFFRKAAAGTAQPVNSSTSTSSTAASPQLQAVVCKLDRFHVRIHCLDGHTSTTTKAASGAAPRKGSAPPSLDASNKAAVRRRVFVFVVVGEIGDAKRSRNDD